MTPVYYKMKYYKNHTRRYGIVVCCYAQVRKENAHKFFYVRVESVYTKDYTGLNIGDYLYEFGYNLKKLTGAELACYLL